jgi:hypothetical protein
MKTYLLLFFLLLSIDTSMAQEGTWKKQALTKFNLKSNESIAEENLKMSDIGLGAGARMHEQVLMMKGNTSYTTYYTGEKEKWRLAKKAGGVETTVEFDITGGAQTINDEGYIVVIDFSHGSGDVFQFYSPDLKKLNTYKPFSSGYDMMQVGYYKDRVCIYSIKTHNSPSYKIALLDKTGNLLAEKEYEVGRHGAFKIEMSNEIVALFLHVYEQGSNKYNTKIISFNSDLNKVWEKEYNSAIGYGITSDPKTHDILFRQHDGKITCLDEISGETKWVLNSSTILPNYQKSNFQAEYTQDGGALVVNLSLYNTQASSFDENILTILNPATGKIEFKEAQGFSSKILKIIPMDHKFRLIKDDQIFEFSNAPQQ